MTTTTLTPKECEIIRLLAANDLVMMNVARATFYHTNTIRYHVQRITQKTGLNPTKFYDMVALLDLVKAQEVGT